MHEEIWKNNGGYLFNTVRSDVAPRIRLDIYVYHRGEEIGCLRSYIDDRTLYLETIVTKEDHKRKGLGNLRVSEALKYLESNNLDVKDVIAVDVGTIGIAVEGISFAEHLGFQRMEGLDDRNWIMSKEALAAKLKTF